MTEKETQLISIDDIEYNLDSMTEAQKVLLSHVADLDNKLRSAQFNFDQLNICKQSFVRLLKESLEAA